MYVWEGEREGEEEKKCDDSQERDFDFQLKILWVRNQRNVIFFREYTWNFSRHISYRCDDV